MKQFVIDRLKKPDNTLVGNKKALLIGLNYTGTEAALKGCINDAYRMKQTLSQKFSYNDITIMTDENISLEMNVNHLLENLIKTESETIYFQYSGHGVQIYDYNYDEDDMKDECLYSVNGSLITDDQLNQIIKQVPAHKTLIIVIDACHSGSVIDLPYQYRSNKMFMINQDQIRGNVICISGCEDKDVSMDISDGTQAYGAMSNSLQKILKRITKRTTWRDLIEAIRKDLKRHGYTQVPQLSSSRPDIMDQVVKL